VFNGRTFTQTESVRAQGGARPLTATTETVVAQEPRCPYCLSADIASKPLQPASYWRCETCGQLWHPNRLPARETGRVVRR
jgi:ribosomal protein L37AE/L43A